MEVNDRELLEMIQSPFLKNKGYRILVNTYKERLYWHIRRMVFDHQDADDILQNTFLKVVRNIADFNQKSSLYTWLYRIATNETLNYLNTSKNKKFEQLDSDIKIYVTESGEVDEVVIMNKLTKAIHTLPEKQRLVFNLRYFDEMSYRDIAEITGTSVGALKASYHHAVKKIEDFLILES